MEADLELPMVAPSGPIVASIVHSPTLISRVKGSAGREGPAGTARSNDGGAAAVGDVERKVCFRARSVERDIPGFAKLFSPRAVSGRTSALGVVPLLGPSRREPTSETPVPLRRDSAAAPVLIEPRKFDFNLGGDAEVSALGVLTSDGLIDDPQVVQKLEPLPSSVPQLSQKRIIDPYFHEQHNKTGCRDFLMYRFKALVRVNPCPLASKKVTPQQWRAVSPLQESLQSAVGSYPN